MGTAYNPNIVRNGLIYYTDFANLKSYPPTGNDPYVSNVTLQLNGEGSAVYDSSIYSRTISVKFSSYSNCVGNNTTEGTGGSFYGLIPVVRIYNGLALNDSQVYNNYYNYLADRGRFGY
jgi:hypothetical protein